MSGTAAVWAWNRACVSRGVPVPPRVSRPWVIIPPRSCKLRQNRAPSPFVPPLATSPVVPPSARRRLGRLAPLPVQDRLAEPQLRVLGMERQPFRTGAQRRAALPEHPLRPRDQGEQFPRDRVIRR